MREYILTKNTYAIIPLDNKKSMIYEEEKSFIVNRSPNYLINFNCLMYGSSIKGRLKATEVLTGYSYKAPILISERENIIFFPTCSPRLKKVAWINLSSINRYYYNENKRKTIVILSNGKQLEFDTSIGIMNNQILRATRLESQIRKNVSLN